MMNNDEYLIQKMNGVIFFSHATAEAQIRSLREVYPEKGYEIFHNINTDRINYFIYRWDKIHELGAHLLKKMEKKPDFFPYVLRFWRKKADELEEYENKLEKEDFQKYTDKELLETMNQLIHLYQQEFGYPMLCDAFSMHIEPVIIEKIKEILNKKGENEKITECISTLTTPADDSFTSRHNKSLMELAIKISRNPEIKKQVEQGNFDIRDEEINGALENHVNNYFWITNGYHKGVRVDKNYFLDEIKSLFIENMDVEKELEELKKQTKLNRQKKKELLEKLEADKDFRNMVEWIEKFAFLHDERKIYVLKTTAYFNDILEEISRRKNISLEDLHTCFYFEIKDILEGKFNKNEIEKRKKLCYYVITDNDFISVSGEYAEKWRKKFLERENDLKITEIKGTAASLGTAKGKVKVITHFDEFKKMEKGDILV
ncbi:hypothetical protein JXB01_01890, partial [Candidatus Micrarchaeota archaeon]|nr:hypothetical protein [Candidatus Micrarchaeota archaeon]